MQISSWLFRTIMSRFDSVAAKVDGVSANVAEVKEMVQQLLQGQDNMALTMQDLETKADAAAAANNELISMAQAQAKMLRDALAGGNSAEQQAAMQAVADKLDGLAAADTAEVAADTLSAPPPPPPPADGSGAPPTP